MSTNFDLMAQLERAFDGLKMNGLSRRMMVTGGNVTGITGQLVREDLVERVRVPGGRRAYRVCLTPRGRAECAEMARAHEVSGASVPGSSSTARTRPRRSRRSCSASAAAAHAEDGTAVRAPAAPAGHA